MNGGEVTAVRGRLQARLLAEGVTSDLASRVHALVADEAPLLGHHDRARLAGEVLDQVCGLGPLEPLFADPDVSEIMVNSSGAVWVESGGALRRIPISLKADAVGHLIEKIVAPLGLRIDRSSPLVDARLADGSRVNAVVPPLAIDGPCLTIRRFATRNIPISAFAGESVGALLTWAVAARQNIVVSGGTGAGKTTLLNALAGCIPSQDRIITVEDTAELRLPGDHVVRLEARPANCEGAGEVSVRELVRNALRMRPDRIIVGEVRGPEALDMLQAMNTGHEGSLSTCHANSPLDALRRIETMVLMGAVQLPLSAIRGQLEAALDLVVQVSRASDGQRVVTSVAEVVDRGLSTEDSAGPELSSGRVRQLADARGLTALPARPPRATGSSPLDSAWLVG